ncbi:Glycerol kinase-2 [Operophtera brumata]|uniref:Glycerol kinase-2 n=1 Tax=Operophtera brumata TaxID=104452 RepID=A0A0L7LTR6_OPEBR|nr:Glycerol kinase-2 [Operophtera brumata]
MKIRPLMTESTALGAAIVAGRALRVWPTSTPSPPADTFLPSISSEGIRPLMTESTALGAAIVAGRALRVWPTSTPSPPADTFLPSISSEDDDEDKQSLMPGLFFLGTALLVIIADKFKAL